MATIVIVTRHNAAVEWLRRNGIIGNVIAQATPNDIKGNDVIGILASSVTEISMLEA